ncbi:MAG: NAD(P)H-dependent oxidoreductase [Pseudomonadota bacterium]
MPVTVLHIDSSARTDGSISRDMTRTIVARQPDAQVITRDIGTTPVPQITQDWVGASFTPEDARSTVQKEVLALSDTLVNELIAADTIVIGAPMYNFSIPAALKAWIDQVARPGRTFNYTSDGPLGLLQGKRVIVVAATGGVPMGSDMDFAGPYLKFVLGFLGLTDVTIVAADGANADEAAARAKAQTAIDELFKAA